MTVLFISCGEADCEGKKQACLTYDSENNCNLKFFLCVKYEAGDEWQTKQR